MTFTRWLALLLLPAGLTAFAPQPYHTADVNAGELSFTPSVAGEYFKFAFGFLGAGETGLGISPQISMRFTIPNSSSLSLVLYGGGMFNKEGFGVLEFEIESMDVSVIPNVELGLQWEPWEKEDFSLGLSAGFPSLISLTLMKGIRSRKLDREVVTLGIKSLLYFPSMLFATVHPTERFHLSVGASIIPWLCGEVHAGIGYTFNLAKQEKGEGNETIEE